MEPSQEWHDTGQKLYGVLRQSFNHDETIARLIVLSPDVTDWITEAEETWKKTYEKA